MGWGTGDSEKTQNDSEKAKVPNTLKKTFSTYIEVTFATSFSATKSFMQLLGVTIEKYRATQITVVTLLQTLCLYAISLLPYMWLLKASQSSFKMLFKVG